MNNSRNFKSALDDDIDFNGCLNHEDLARIFDEPTADGPKARPNKTLSKNDLIDAKRAGTSAASIIEKYFRKNIQITQNGKCIRVTIYEAIILTLHAKAVAGNHQALAALIRYSKFGNEEPELRRPVLAMYEFDDGVYMERGAR